MNNELEFDRISPLLAQHHWMSVCRYEFRVIFFITKTDPFCVSASWGTIASQHVMMVWLYSNLAGQWMHFNLMFFYLCDFLVITAIDRKIISFVNCQKKKKVHTISPLVENDCSRRHPIILSTSQSSPATPQTYLLTNTVTSHADFSLWHFFLLFLFLICVLCRFTDMWICCYHFGVQLHSPCICSMWLFSNTVNCQITISWTL